MRNIIAGTAGHIDHGKSALVRALTGIEPDRWEEERRRGISIDLGFAHLELDKDIRVAFIDVPGHERFVKNMLAGAGGIDIVLLVIGADESIKPQTREHFDICRLLGIRHGLVVLTKADLVDPDIAELVKLEAEDFVKGSFLEGAPVIAVSSKTGEGLDLLRRELSVLARSIPEKDAAGYLRLPVDRAFSMKGFGAVVTGTLISGRVSVEQEIEVQPGGRRARVRGLQVHGSASRQARAGQRTALNLAGLDTSGLGRGMTVVEPGSFEAVSLIDCELELLPSAKPLKHRAPVHFHAWTAETEAQVRLLDREVLQAGASAPARFVLKNPVQVLPGDRFIVRMFSPVLTIGGGTVVDIVPPERSSRRKAAARIVTLARSGPEDRVSMLVQEAEFGLGLRSVAARTGLPKLQLEAAAKSPRLMTLAGPEPWLVDAAWFAAAQQKIHDTCAAYHREHPLLPGVPRESIRGRELAAAPHLVLDALLAQSKTVVAEGEILRLKSHRLHLEQDEQDALGRIEKAFQDAGLAVPALAEVLAGSGVEAGRSRSLLQILLRQKKLVRIGEDLVYHHSAIETLKQILAARKGARFGVPAFKDWTGVSRKYAIPLLEFLDRERVTRRDGDERLVL
jgi:selenocysteine-specific elongation factor